MVFVFAFDHKHDTNPMNLKDLLGGKGANLAEMTSVLGLPVPPGFTITTDACRAWLRSGWPAGLDDEIEEHVAGLERRMAAQLGDPQDPLLVSVRSGAKFSMPGMMDTVLDLGLNDESVEGLASRTDRRFAPTHALSCALRSRPSSARGPERGPSPTATASTFPTTSARRSTCKSWCTAIATKDPAPVSDSLATPRLVRRVRMATSS